jgi:hypothetical protein
MPYERALCQVKHLIIWQLAAVGPDRYGADLTWRAQTITDRLPPFLRPQPPHASGCRQSTCARAWDRRNCLASRQHKRPFANEPELPSPGGPLLGYQHTAAYLTRHWPVRDGSTLGGPGTTCPEPLHAVPLVPPTPVVSGQVFDFHDLGR